MVLGLTQPSSVIALVGLSAALCVTITRSVLALFKNSVRLDDHAQQDARQAVRNIVARNIGLPCLGST